MENENQKNDGVVGPIIGSIIVIILIVIGGIYYWNSVLNKDSQSRDLNTEVNIETELAL